VLFRSTHGEPGYVPFSHTDCGKAIFDDEILD
jgi:hypothetical protein